MKRIFGIVLILMLLAAFTPLGCFAAELTCNPDGSETDVRIGIATVGTPEFDYTLTGNDSDCLYNNLALNGEITLNLNGKKLTVNSLKCDDNVSCSLKITGTGTLIVNDSVEVTNDLTVTGGTVSVGTVTASGGITGGNGDIIVNGGTVSVGTVTASGGITGGNGGIIVNGGTVTASKGNISADYGDVIINGGTVTASGGSISAGSSVKISSGTVTASGGGISAELGVTISGGQTDAKTIKSYGDSILLGLTNETDFIHAGTYSAGAGITASTRFSAFADADTSGNSRSTIEEGEVDASKINGLYLRTWRSNHYTITWNDHDGTVLKTTTVTEGDTPAYGGEAPTRAGTAQYSYTFSGWTPTIGPAAADTIYTAEYTAVINQYSVTFTDEDGTVLKEAVKYPYGTKAADIARPADPVKPATAEESFTFAGWRPEIADVTKDAVYKAAYDAVFNGNELTCGNLEKYGSLAEGEYVLSEDCTYNGSISLTGDVTIDLNAKSLTAGAIVCSGSSQCSLTIRDTTDIGLLNSVISVTGDLTINGGIVKASGDGIRAGGGVSFSGGQVIIEGPISAKNIDLSWTKSTDFIHAGNYSGTIKAEKPFTAFEQDWKIKYSADIGTGTVEAGQINGKWLYPPEYTVTWINDDGVPLKTDHNVLWGTIPAYSGKTPELAPEGGYRYSFRRWQPEISPVTGDATYTAKYEDEPNIFTVTVTTEGEGIAFADPASGEAGTFVMLKAYPDNGWRLREWQVVSGYDVKISKDNTFTIRMEDVVINAVFEPPSPYKPVPVGDNEPQTAADDKTYVIGSGEEKKFRFERWVDDGTDVAFDDFEKALNQAEGSGGIRLLINGQSLPPELQPVLHRDYDYSRGSVIITLYPSYLDTLPVGEYTMETFFADDNGEICPSPVHLSVTEPGDIKIFNIKNDGNYGIPEDIDAAEYTLTIQIFAGDSLLREAKDVKLTVEPGRKDPYSLQDVPFNVLGKDDTADADAARRIVITGLPKEVIGYGPEVYDAASGTTVRPVQHKYALSVRDARFSQSGEILVYLLWDDGSRPVEEIRVVALPEDEIGAYQLRPDGTKEYLLFQTYDICMAYLGSDALCRGPERCYHK